MMFMSILSNLPSKLQCGLHCERGDDVFGSNVIMEDIRRSIESEPDL